MAEKEIKFQSLVNSDLKKVGDILSDGKTGFLCQEKEVCIFCAKEKPRGAKNSLLCLDCSTKLKKRMRWDKVDCPANAVLYDISIHGQLVPNTKIWNADNRFIGFIVKLHNSSRYGNYYEMSRDVVENIDDNLYTAAHYPSIWLLEAE